MSSNTLDGGGEPFGTGWTSYSIGLLLGLLLIGLAAWSVVKSLAETEELQPSLPNVLLLVADDLGYNDVGSFGDGNALTPNIDALAAEGVSFTRHYADTTCSPSRVALLTGMFPQRMGFRHNGIVMSEEYPTIAELLKAGGYDTAAVGKWHAGSHYREGWPLQKGFDRWFGFLTQFQLAKIVPHDSDVRMTPTYVNPVLRVGNKPPQKHDGHLTDLLLQESLDFLKQETDLQKPWFLYHAFFAPHTPIQPESRFAARFDASPEGKYQALVYQMDDAIGQIIAALKQSGQYENTLIVFLSDNGGTNKTRDNNAPFYGSKAEYYEGSFRTPMIISWPNTIPRNEEINTIAMNVDVLPTVMELVGLPSTQVTDGYSYATKLLQRGHSVAPKRSRLWEEYVWRMDANSYSYLDGEDNQRFSGLWGISNHWSDLNMDASGATSLSTDSGEIYRTVAARYWRHHNEMATLVQADLQDLEGHWQFNKYDWMRTPGLSGFSIGMGIGPLSNDRVIESTFPLLVAEQSGVWSLQLSEDHVLTWEVGGQKIHSEALDLSRCNEIVLSSHTTDEMRLEDKNDELFDRREGTLIKMFVNDRIESHTSYAEPKLSVSSIRQPTIVFDSMVLGREKIYIRNTSTSLANEPFNVLVRNKTIQHALASNRGQNTLFYGDLNLTKPRLCQN